MHIIIKPQKRCNKCGHLVPTDRNQCPYCKEESDFISQVSSNKKITTNPQPTKPISKKTIKIGLIAIGVVALIVTTFLIIEANKINKSIFDPIDSEYAVNKNKELPGFWQIYSSVNSKRNRFVDSTQYKEITYKRLYEFIQNFYNNSDFYNEIKQTAIIEHEEKYRKPEAIHIQNLLDEWDEYARTHNVNNYLQVSVITDYLIQNDYYDYESCYRPKFYFRLTYPAGSNAIIDCNATVTIDYENTTNRVDLKTLKENDNSKNYLYLNWIDDSSFWDYHSVTVTINSVTLKDGTKIYATDASNIPYSVRNYQYDKSLENEEQIIKECINKDYIMQSDYIHDKLNKELMEKDSLCYKFIRNFMY